MAKEICQGMTQSTLAAVLGSPNIITKDQNGTQTWIYDKITREVAFRQDPDGQWLILEGYERSAAARDKTAKNLMVIVKFDEHECIEKVSCHSSKF